MNKAATNYSDDSISLSTKKISTKKTTKQSVNERVIEGFIRVGNAGFYQIEGYQHLKITCLHTYVSNLEKQGIKFDRKYIKHKNSDGGHTQFMRYWLADDDARKAALVRLSEMRVKRNAPPIQGDFCGGFAA